MKIAVTGGTGFIGSALVKALRERGHEVRVLSRQAKPQEGVRVFAWDPMEGEPPEESLDGVEAVIHLAGEPLAQRWTAEVKRKIAESRSKGTRHLVQAMTTMSPRPRVLVSASAIGIYGDRGEELLTETSKPGKGFLASTTAAWEEQALLAESLGMRVACLRTGIVLGDGGALREMLLPFRLGVGGKIAGGRQWMSWIHLEDMVGLYVMAVEDEGAKGPINGVAPFAVTNAEFTRTLARVLRRPAVLPIPALALKVLFGEMSKVLMESQRVVPLAADRLGFRFRYPKLGPALEGILGR